MKNSVELVKAQEKGYGLGWVFTDSPLTLWSFGRALQRLRALSLASIGFREPHKVFENKHLRSGAVRPVGLPNDGSKASGGVMRLQIQR